MKFKRTQIVAIVDRSGSMASVKDDAEGGLNAFLDDQRKLDGKCRLTLAQFDDQYDLVWDDVDLHDLRTPYKLEPRSMTALLDAVGKTINAVRPNIKKSDQVFVVIVTDGHENSSREWKHEQIKNLLEEVQKEGWNVSFIGAGIDAFAEASALGINQNTTLQTNNIGMASYSSLSSSVLRARNTGAVMDYSDAEREQAVQS